MYSQIMSLSSCLPRRVLVFACVYVMGVHMSTPCVMVTYVLVHVLKVYVFMTVGFRVTLLRYSVCMACHVWQFHLLGALRVTTVPHVVAGNLETWYNHMMILYISN